MSGVVSGEWQGGTGQCGGRKKSQFGVCGNYKHWEWECVWCVVPRRDPTPQLEILLLLLLLLPKLPPYSSYTPHSIMA